MSRYAIIDTSQNPNLVVNVVEYPTAPSNPPPGFASNFIAVQSDTVSPGWTYVNATLTPPSAVLPSLAQAKITQSQLLQTSAATTLAAGFSSSALGSANTYPSDLQGQIIMVGSVLDAITPLPQWVASNSYQVGQSVQLPTGQRFTCTVAGTSGLTAPTAIGVDGTVTWAQWTTSIISQPHTTAQAIQAARDVKQNLTALRLKLHTLITQVQAATTVDAVQAITWSFP